MRRLRASYDALPPDAPVRLAKRTSNLFRTRAAAAAPGLDVSGLGGEHSVCVAIDCSSSERAITFACTADTSAILASIAPNRRICSS